MIGWGDVGQGVGTRGSRGADPSTDGGVPGGGTFRKGPSARGGQIGKERQREMVFLRRSQKIKNQGEKWEAGGGWEKDSLGSWGSGASGGPRKELNGREAGKVTRLSDYLNVLYLLIMNFISSAWGGHDSAQIGCKFMEMQMQRGCRRELPAGMVCGPPRGEVTALWTWGARIRSNCLGGHWPQLQAKRGADPVALEGLKKEV